MGAATHPITDAIWREALAPELALTVSEWTDRHSRRRQAPGRGVGESCGGREGFLMLGFRLNIRHFLDRCNPDVIYSTDILWKILQGLRTAASGHGYFMRIL
jgi:hypothetical protein